MSGSGDGTVRIWDTEPPARRHQARREAEALRPEAERLVARLFAELREPAEVVARLRADASLSDPTAPRGRAGGDAPGAASNTVDDSSKTGATANQETARQYARSGADCA